jgi:hypothetical protein
MTVREVSSAAAPGRAASGRQAHGTLAKRQFSGPGVTVSQQTETWRRAPAYNRRVAWELRMTAQTEKWFRGLSPDRAEQIAASLDKLEETGPGLGRPFVDSIKGSRYHHLKEARSIGGHQRALFAFDPQRRGIVLVAGDKRDNWRGWYKTHIPIAEREYQGHLRGTGTSQPWAKVRAGAKSAVRER